MIRLSDFSLSSRRAGLLPPAAAGEPWLMTVIAVLCFLACLAAVAASAADRAAHGWARQLGAEATVQVRPTVGQIVELMAEQAATRLAAHTPVAIGASIGQRIMLPAISVRPGLRQVQAKAADIAAEAATTVVVQGLPSR